MENDNWQRVFLQLAPNQANPVNWIMDRNFTAITVASDAWQQGLIDAVVVSYEEGRSVRDSPELCESCECEW